MQNSISGKVAVVTGGASGIGRATAFALAQHGARVFVGDYDPLPTTIGEFHQLGIIERRCDVRVESDVRSLIDFAIEQAGGLDILVNNAGIAMVKPITEVTEQE